MISFIKKILSIEDLAVILFLVMISASPANNQNIKQLFSFSKKEIREEDQNQSVVCVAELSDGALSHYRALKKMLAHLEKETNFKLTPDRHPKIILKVDSKAAPGLCVSSELLDATLDLMMTKGYAKEKVTILCFDFEKIRRSFAYSDGMNGSFYNGHRIRLPSDYGFYHSEWFHESPMPPKIHDRAKFFLRFRNNLKKRMEEERKSYLPSCFLDENVFWINLAVAMDDPFLGISGASVNMTLEMATNARRFRDDPTIGAAAVTEILAIPEIWNNRLLSIIDLTRFQFAGGIHFDSEFISSEPRLLMSRNPFAVDSIAWDLISNTRSSEGHSLRKKSNALLFQYAENLGLGKVIKPKVLAIVNTR